MTSFIPSRGDRRAVAQSLQYDSLVRSARNERIGARGGRRHTLAFLQILGKIRGTQLHPLGDIEDDDGCEVDSRRQHDAMRGTVGIAENDHLLGDQRQRGV
jgi:hypothetical protein